MGKGCMRSAELHASALRVCGVTLQFHIALSAQYMASDGSIVAGADVLSRTEDDYTGMLKTAVFRKLWGCEGPYFVNCCSPDAVPRVMSGRQFQCVSPLTSSHQGSHRPSQHSSARYATRQQGTRRAQPRNASCIYRSKLKSLCNVRPKFATTTKFVFSSVLF